jgi:Tryptophan-associated transmembrane protein (Trp_oprn_chp)
VSEWRGEPSARKAPQPAHGARVVHLRRQLTIAVVACAAGAALALWAGSRTWATTRTARPAPLPAAITDHTGASLAPLLPALALVALACAGALLATRSWARLVVGAVMALAGVGVAIEAVRVAVSTTGVRVIWPVLCVVGAVIVLGAAGLTLRGGRAWPAMGARYERAGPVDATVDRSAAGMWDAIDRGHDPTRSDRPEDPR